MFCLGIHCRLRRTKTLDPMSTVRVDQSQRSLLGSWRPRDLLRHTRRSIARSVRCKLRQRVFQGGRAMQGPTELRVSRLEYLLRRQQLWKCI